MKIHEQNSEISKISEFFLLDLRIWDRKSGFPTDRFSIFERLVFDAPTPKSLRMNGQRETPICLDDLGFAVDLDPARPPGLL